MVGLPKREGDVEQLQALPGAGFALRNLPRVAFPNPVLSQGPILPGHSWSTAPKISPRVHRGLCTEGLGLCCSPNTNAEHRAGQRHPKPAKPCRSHDWNGSRPSSVPMELNAAGTDAPGDVEGHAQGWCGTAEVEYCQDL